MGTLANGIGNKRQQRKVACTLDCGNKLSLMLCTRAGDALRNDLALLGSEALQLFFVFVIDVDFFRVTEAASPLFAGHLAFLLAARFSR